MRRIVFACDEQEQRARALAKEFGHSWAWTGPGLGGPELEGSVVLGRYPPQVEWRVGPEGEVQVTVSHNFSRSRVVASLEPRGELFRIVELEEPQESLAHHWGVLARCERALLGSYDRVCGPRLGKAACFLAEVMTKGGRREPWARQGIWVLRYVGARHPGLVLPGGKVEPGEGLREAAVRELWEETGLVPVAPGPELVYRNISGPMDVWCFAGPVLGVPSRGGVEGFPMISTLPELVRESRMLHRGYNRRLAQSLGCPAV